MGLASILHSVLKPFTLVVAVFFLTIAFLFAVVIYRLYFSPLSKFPGPSLAAITSAYEGYFDCFKDGGGRYYVEINRMHDLYGPVVRINPWELHIQDPEWTEIYKITRRAYKPVWYYRTLSTSGSTLSSESSEMHHLRRDAIQPYFSAASVARFQPQVETLVTKMCARLRAFKGKNQVVNIGDVFRCLATDVATAYTFRKPFGHLDHPDFEHDGNASVRNFSPLGLLNRQLRGWIFTLVKSIPSWLSRRMASPATSGVREFYSQMRKAVDAEYGTESGKNQGNEPEINLVWQILSSSLPAPEKVYERVARECSSVTLAGTETTGGALSFIAFLLLDHPTKLARLKKEIGDAEQQLGRQLTYQELKELPYLTGAINEGFRLNSGVSGRLPRYDPKQDVKYKNWIIPKGTIISATQNDTNFNPTIFTEPYSFIPERWLDRADRRRLSKYLFSFGRGARSCLGMEVAYIQIYLALGRLFSPDVDFSLELYDTEYERDVVKFHDYFAPFPRSQNGIRVFVR